MFNETDLQDNWIGASLLADGFMHKLQQQQIFLFLVLTFNAFQLPDRETNVNITWNEDTRGTEFFWH